MSVVSDQELIALPSAAPQDAEAPVFPPSDLYSDEPPLESYQHLTQLILLLTCLERYWKDRNDFFAAGSLTVYYSPQ